MVRALGAYRGHAFLTVAFGHTTKQMSQTSRHQSPLVGASFAVMFDTPVGDVFSRPSAVNF